MRALVDDVVLERTPTGTTVVLRRRVLRSRMHRDEEEELA
jgi:hypothetical protein